MLLHTGRFVLEDAHCFAALEEFVSLFVVHGDGLHVKLYPVALFNEGDGVLDQSEGLQPQEVHFQQAGRLHYGVIELRAPHFAVLGGSHGNEIADIRGSDNDAAGVNARIAQGALQNLGLVEGFARSVFLVRHIAQRLRLLVVVASERLPQGLVVQA